MNQYELDMEYIRLVNEWYVTNGLLNLCKKIFKISGKDWYLSVYNSSDFSKNIQLLPIFCPRYIPLEDLYQIYKLYYGREIMPRRVIEACTSILWLER